MTRTIPTCPDCCGDLEPELDAFYCVPCKRPVAFGEAVFLEDDDDD